VGNLVFEWVRYSALASRLQTLPSNTPTCDVWHRRGPNLEPGLVRELLLHHHRVHGTDEKSAERAVVGMYTACSVPIRDPASVQLAHAEHLSYETRFVYSATSTRGASLWPAHALHPASDCPLLGPPRAALLDLSSSFMCKTEDAYSRQHPAAS